MIKGPKQNLQGCKGVRLVAAHKLTEFSSQRRGTAGVICTAEFFLALPGFTRLDGTYTMHKQALFVRPCAGKLVCYDEW